MSEYEKLVTTNANTSITVAHLFLGCRIYHRQTAGKAIMYVGDSEPVLNITVVNKTEHSI